MSTMEAVHAAPPATHPTTGSVPALTLQPSESLVAHWQTIQSYFQLDDQAKQKYYDDLPEELKMPFHELVQEFQTIQYSLMIQQQQIEARVQQQHLDTAPAPAPATTAAPASSSPATTAAPPTATLARDTGHVSATNDSGTASEAVVSPEGTVRPDTEPLQPHLGRPGQLMAAAGGGAAEATVPASMASSSGPEQASPAPAASETHGHKTPGTRSRVSDTSVIAAMTPGAYSDTSTVSAIRKPSAAGNMLATSTENINRLQVSSQELSLHLACADGNAKVVEKLLREFSFPDARDDSGKTPMMYAVLSNSLACAKELLKQGASIDVSDDDGRTPLHWAAFHEKDKVLKLLLSRGGQSAARDSEGRTPLHWASGNKQMKCVKMLLKSYSPAELNIADNEQMTPLHWACYNSKLDIVKLLIKAGADLTLTDMEGKTALHWATGNRSGAIAQFLLQTAKESGNRDFADMVDLEGRAALHLAIGGGVTDVVAKLLDNGADAKCVDRRQRTTLHWATVSGHRQCIPKLIAEGATVMETDQHGATALHYAAQQNLPHAISDILSTSREHGVTAIKDTDGWEPLGWAALYCNLQAAQALLNFGANVHAFNNQGVTAMHAVASQGNTDLLALFQQHGAHVDPIDKNMQTPLFRACEFGHVDVARILIQQGASLAMVDIEGRTPLHWAAVHGQTMMAWVLLESGALVDSTDKAGRSALHCAAHAGQQDICSTLIERGAVINLQDKDGITALHWAALGGNLACMRVLLEGGAYPNFFEKDGEKNTPMDYALFSDKKEAMELLAWYGGMRRLDVMHLAAVIIQSHYRGHRCRKSSDHVRRKKELAVIAEHEASAAEAAAPSEPEDDAASAVTEPEDVGLAAIEHDKEAPPAKITKARTTLQMQAKQRMQEEEQLRLRREDEQRRQNEERRLRHLHEEHERQRRAQEQALKLRKKREQDAIKKKNMEKRDLAARTIQRYWIRYRIIEIQKRQEKVREYLNAVVVIQRAWRNYLDRTNGSRRAKENMSLVAEMRDLRKFGSAKRREREIAALTIQLAFRRHLRRKYQMMTPPALRHEKAPWSPSELAKLQRHRVEHIYGTPHTLVEQYEPNLSKSLFIRPSFKTFHESAAVKSFNFAFREYHPDRHTCSTTITDSLTDSLMRPNWNSAVTHLSTFSAIFRRNQENYQDSLRAASFQKVNDDDAIAAV